MRAPPLLLLLLAPLLAALLAPRPCAGAEEALVGQAVQLRTATFTPWLLVVARMRSGSTHLTSLLAQHSCVVDVGEALSLVRNRPGMDHRRVLAATAGNWSDGRIAADPVGFLKAIHPLLACAPTCAGCTAVAKLFDSFDKFLLHPTGGGRPAILARLANYWGARLVLLERDAAQEHCSMSRYRETGDFSWTPVHRERERGERRADQRAREEACMAAAREGRPTSVLTTAPGGGGGGKQKNGSSSAAAKVDYAQDKVWHDSWFSAARRAARDGGRPWLELPFPATVAPCALYEQVVPQLLQFAGQDPAGVGLRDPSVAACPWS